MAIVDALNKVTGGHGSTIEEAVKNLSTGGGGGGGLLTVNAEWGAGDKIVADHTYAEIKEAIDNDVIVRVLFGGGGVFNLCNIDNVDGSISYSFNAVSINPISVTNDIITFDPDGGIYFLEIEYDPQEVNS